MGSREDQYHLQEARLYFRADPHRPEAIKGPSGSNFTWVAYQVLFSVPGKETPDFYYYSVNLNPDGSRQNGTERVHYSDQAFKNDGPAEIRPETVREKFGVLQGPSLEPYKNQLKTEYILVHVAGSSEPKGTPYNPEDFKRVFVDSGKYTIPSGKPKGLEAVKLVDPFGQEVQGLSYPKETDMETSNKSAVKLAMERVRTVPLNVQHRTGFRILLAKLE